MKTKIRSPTDTYYLKNNKLLEMTNLNEYERQRRRAESVVWKNLGSAKQKSINLVLLFGKPGSGKNLSGTEDQKWVATQLIVWEFVSGCRSTADGYKCTNTKFNLLLVQAPEYKSEIFGSAGGR